MHFKDTFYSVWQMLSNFLKRIGKNFTVYIGIAGGDKPLDTWPVNVVKQIFCHWYIITVKYVGVWKKYKEYEKLFVTMLSLNKICYIANDECIIKVFS